MCSHLGTILFPFYFSPPFARIICPAASLFPCALPCRVRHDNITRPEQCVSSFWGLHLMHDMIYCGSDMCVTASLSVHGSPYLMAIKFCRLFFFFFFFYNVIISCSSTCHFGVVMIRGVCREKARCFAFALVFSRCVCTPSALCHRCGRCAVTQGCVLGYNM